MWQTTGHIGGYILCLGLRTWATRLVSMPSNNIKTSTISSSVNGGHLTWLNLVSAMSGHFRKWNARLCGCFAFWNDHITFSFFIVISAKYHNWKILPSHPFLCCVKSSAMGIIGIGTALASPHVGPYSNYAHGLRSYPTLEEHLDKIHWVLGEHFTSMTGLLEKGRDVTLLLKSARNLMPTSLQDLSHS